MNGYKLIAGAVIRHLLGAVCAALVAHGLVTQQDANSFPIAEITIGIVGFLGNLTWSLWQKATAKWKFLEALTLDPNTSPGSAEVLLGDKPKTIPGTIKALTE